MSSTQKDKGKSANEPNEKVHKNVKLALELKKVGCKAHGDDFLINDISNGDLICEKCGLVVQERMVCDEAEWRNFDGDTMAEKWSKSRTGDAENPFLSDDYNLGTSIKMFDANKNNVSTFSGNIVNQYKRRSIDNALNHAFKEIRDMCDRINLPSSVQSTAKKLYAQLYHHIKLKGNILLVDSKTAACLYIACRQENCYRSTREIAAIYAVNKRDLTRAIKRTIDKLSLDLTDPHGTEMIGRYSGHMELSREEQKKARRIATVIENNTTQITPKKMTAEAIAGVSIYLAKASTQGTITGREYAKQRQRLREDISSVIGITASMINRSSNLVKDDLPLDLFT